MRTLFAVALSLALGITICTGCSLEDDEEKIKVGSKDFTENKIVAEIYTLALEDAGLKVERAFEIESSKIHTALIDKEIDMYPEYTGTGLVSVLNLERMTDPEKVYQTVKEEYEKQFGVTWLAYSKANDGQGIAMRTDLAEKYRIKTISELQKYAQEFRFVSQEEFEERADGILALEATYGKFPWKSKRICENGEKYDVLANGEADVCYAYTTEGRLVEGQFTLLEDDKQAWAPYNLTPIVRESVLKKYPQIEEALNKVSAALTTQNITAMNAQVDIAGEKYTDVAKKFYASIK